MQLELLHESVNDALVFLVQALGGAKRVGHTMRPELPVDQSASWVRDCLNPTRRERFSPEQVVLLLRLGRQAGVHSAMNYICGDAGYENPPVLEPGDELAQLQRQYIASVKAQSLIADRLERLVQVQPTLRNVA